MPPPSQNVVRMWRSPVHLLPTEILSIIFLLVVEDLYVEDCVELMLVCRHWYDIMLSTPGMPSRLWIGKSTTVEVVRAAIQGMWLLYVEIDINDGRIGQDFNADAFDACFMTAIEAASRWKTLTIHSLPRPGEWKAFHIVPPLKNLESIGLERGCDLGNFFEPLMTAITTTATPHLTNMNFCNLNAVLYLVQPGCLRVLRSLTRLTIRLPKRMESPANILPHLHRLEYFNAEHLYLPFYPPEARLPLIQTLREVSLRSVSVQWMAGRVFPLLWRCFIKFPHQADAICDQPVTMPTCTSLTYQSNNLDPLRNFHDLPLAGLTVTSGQWNITRGNLELMIITHMVVPSAQSLTMLDLQVRCSEQLLTCMLSLLPALDTLYLRLASPRALSETFFQAFVATESDADSPCETGGQPSLQVCSKLSQLEVNYKRWLRGPERMTLLLVFGDIVSSRHVFQLCLRLDDLAQAWFVERHVESIDEIADDELSTVGISSPQGIIPLEIAADDPLTEVPFKEAEYLVAVHQLSIECLLTLRHLVELRLGGEKDVLPSQPPPNLPLFHTLRVLDAGNMHPSFLAGQTFHKLERCRMSLYGEGPTLSEDRVTQMPLCTRLDVDDSILLATLKLPQICQLGVSFHRPEHNMIWEKYITVNANLSGLELLHADGWHQQADLIQALRCLPVLKCLVLSNGSDLDAAFFAEFIPKHETAVLMQSHDESQISPLLCPMLTEVLIEDSVPTKRVAELIPVLKRVTTLRAACGSPLKRFTLLSFETGSNFELIGSEGVFVTEMDSLDEDAEPFSLDIWLKRPGSCSDVDSGTPSVGDWDPR